LFRISETILILNLKMSKNPILQSFKFAFQGLAFAWKERNFKLHIASTLAVLTMGFYYQVTSLEWIILLLCIAGVLSLELLNTALEKFVDLVSPNKHPLAGMAKDLSAAAVLVFSIASAIVGLIIFYPYFFN
jgi:diacylglycerol kinase